MVLRGPSKNGLFLHHILQSFEGSNQGESLSYSSDLQNPPSPSPSLRQTSLPPCFAKNGKVVTPHLTKRMNEKCHVISRVLRPMSSNAVAATVHPTSRKRQWLSSKVATNKVGNRNDYTSSFSTTLSDHSPSKKLSAPLSSPRLL